MLGNRKSNLAFWKKECHEDKEGKTLGGLPNLKKEGENLILKEKTNYCRQIMMQMAVCGAKWCGVFVYLREEDFFP